MKRITKILLALVLALSLSVSPAVELFSSSAHVEAAKKFTICKGEKIRLTATANYKIKSKKWKSSNKKIASISKKGVVTGKKAGKVTITCTMKLKVGKKTRTKKVKCTVKVRSMTAQQMAATCEQQAASKLAGMWQGKGPKLTDGNYMAKADAYVPYAVQGNTGYLQSVADSGEALAFWFGYYNSPDDFLNACGKNYSFQSVTNNTSYTFYYGVSCTYISGKGYYYLLYVK